MTILLFTNCNMSKINSKQDFVGVSPTDELTFECGEENRALIVLSSGKWTVEDLPEWMDVTPKQGKSEDEIIITVKENTEIDDREGRFAITSGSAEVTVKVTQYGSIKTNYIDLDLKDSTTSLAYDENTGKMTISYADGIVDAEDYEGKTIVLPAEYEFDIRVIENSSASGNTLTLETSQGNMSDIFKNVSFALATSSGANTRALEGKRVITPSAVGYFDEHGQYHEKTSIATKDLYFENNEQLWSCHADFSGETIVDGNAGKIYWDKCTFDAGLNALFEFDFGEKQIDEVTRKGDIRRFSYILNGTMDMDLMLHYIYESNYDKEKDDIIKENIIKTIVFKFMVGKVPVYISVDTHLGRALDFSAEGRVDATAGVKLETEMNVGVEWTKVKGAEVIKDIDKRMDIHHPTLEAEASATAKVSYYPHVDIKLYKFLGPWVEPRPYLKEDLKAGLRASTDGENFIGWEEKIYAGEDLKLGLDISFGVWDFTPWESEMLNPVEDNLLFEAPVRITKISPEDGIEIKGGETITAEFLVEAYSPLTETYFPCPNVYVISEVNTGKLVKSLIKNNQEGVVKIEWTPSNTQQTLTVTPTMTASIVNADGDIIDDATLTVETEHEYSTAELWVDLGLPSGIKWAAWNVGASSPEEYGEYFAWGEITEKNIYNFDSYQHKEADTYIYIGDCISGTSYDVATVRWGGGARMPTHEEIQELDRECKWEHGYMNGELGAFAIGPNGNSIFFPFSGDRYYSKLISDGSAGSFWSGTKHPSQKCAYYLYCDRGCARSNDFWSYYRGLPVRPVLD